MSVSTTKSESSKVIVFDFDQTLSTVHVFKLLAGWEGMSGTEIVPPPYSTSEIGQAKKILEIVKSKNSNSLEDLFFGGQDRVNRLKKFFEELKSDSESGSNQHQQFQISCSLYVCTKGLIGAVRIVLEIVDLLKYFDGVYGYIGIYNEDDDHDSGGPGAVSDSDSDSTLLKNHCNLTQFSMDTNPDIRDKPMVCMQVSNGRPVLLIEDDPNEIKKAAARGIQGVLVKERKGIEEKEMKEIKEWVEGK